MTCDLRGDTLARIATPPFAAPVGAAPVPLEPLPQAPAAPRPEPPESLRHWLRGADDSTAAQGIVSVHAERPGEVRVWRRLGPRPVQVTDERYPAWFLARDRSLLAHLPAEPLDAASLRAAHGPRLQDLRGLHVVRLEGGDEDAFRYLVLADAESYPLAEAGVLDAWHKQAPDPEPEDADQHAGGGDSAPSLALLARAGEVAVWPADEQYLLLSGRTYFRGLAFDDVHRLQFDLETTGLDEHHDRIFMVSLRDSSGWTACLEADVGGPDPGGVPGASALRAHAAERDLIERFVRVLRERDPDVLENHSIFAFDLPFLARRAAALGVRLALGRDGSEPSSGPDIFRTGERAEPFTRWCVVGRQVVDTLHAVKRHGAATHDLRRHGLKDAARYFGFARVDREYVPGAEIWTTFKTDPERIRRYALDDVDEVDGLSRRLLRVPFALAQYVPRAYEQVAADWTAPAVLEPLLVRAYLHAAHALPAPPARPRAALPHPTGRARLYRAGVVRPVVRLAAPALSAHLLVAEGIHARQDALRALPRLVGAVLGEQAHAARPAQPGLPALHHLSRGTRTYLATPEALLGDPAAAEALAARTRAAMEGVVRAVAEHGWSPVLLEGDALFLSRADALDPAREQALLDLVRPLLPAGVVPLVEARFAAMYLHGERSYAALADSPERTLSVVGPAFNGGVQERFAERFVRQAASLVLEPDVVALRALFVGLVGQLRRGEVPVEDLCMRVTLHRSPHDYRRSGQPQEPYEVLLDAGVRDWRPGERVRYFRDRSGQPRLLREGDVLPGAAADAEHYVQRLRAVYCPLFARAFQPGDFERLFAIPPADGTVDGAAEAGAFAGVQVVSTPARPIGAPASQDLSPGGDQALSGPPASGPPGAGSQAPPGVSA